MNSHTRPTFWHAYARLSETTRQAARRAYALSAQKPLPVGIIPKDGFPPISPVLDVINRVRILHSQFARHVDNPLTQHLRVKAIFYISRD